MTAPAIADSAGSAALKRRLTRLYIAYQFFFDLLVWLPVFFEYQRRFGLAPAQILAIQSLHYLSFGLLEIPTGIVADRRGYRACLRWGAGVFAAANLLAIFTPTVAGFAAHFVFIALARALVSGSANAWLYEYLSHLGAAAEYKLVEGRARSAGLIGKVACWSAVGLLMSWHLTLPYWITAVAGMIALAVSFALPDLPSSAAAPRLATRHRPWSDIKEVVNHVRRSPYLALVMLQGLGVFALGRVQVTFFQPILMDKGFGAGSFGLIMAVMTLTEAAGAVRPGRLKQRLSDLNAVFVLTAVIALSFTLIAFSAKTGTIAGFLAFSFAIGLVYPIQKQVINDAIAVPGHRAALLSLESMLDRGVSAGIIVLAAGAATNSVLLAAAAVTLAFTALLMAAFRLFARRGLAVS